MMQSILKYSFISEVNKSYSFDVVSDIEEASISFKNETFTSISFNRFVIFSFTSFALSKLDNLKLIIEVTFLVIHLPHLNLNESLLELLWFLNKEKELIDYQDNQLFSLYFHLNHYIMI